MLRVLIAIAFGAAAGLSAAGRCDAQSALIGSRKNATIEALRELKNPADVINLRAREAEVSDPAAA